MRTTVQVSEVLTIIGVLIVPFMIGFRTGRIGTATLWGWLLVFVWTFLWAFAVPMVISRFDHALYRSLCRFFPEEPGVVAAAFMGWVTPGIIALVALLLPVIVQRCWPSAFKRLCI